MHLVAIILALALAGGASLVTGVVLLFGAGWAFVAAGPLLIASAIILRRGIGPNG